MFGSVEGLLDAMRDAQRDERAGAARKVIAAGRFFLRRRAALGGTHDDWCVDDWDVIAAEVAAELGVSRGRASSWMDYGQVLIERLPKVAEVFMAGYIDFRVIRIVAFRTALLTDDQAIASIDEMLAHTTPGWNTLSEKRVAQLVDWMVLSLDPDALRVAKERDDDRHVEVSADHSGMAEIWGRVRATDGAAFNLKLDELAATVCRDDPRTKRQRRADALMALVGGEATMGCLCESERCPAAGNGSTSSAVVVHVLAETATVEGRGSKAGFAPGYGPLPPAMVREVAKTARLEPVRVPKDAATEPRYRPSAALAQFVRNRDLTCRWMGCDKSAWQADIDHTVPVSTGADASVEQRLLLPVSSPAQDISLWARWMEGDATARRHDGLHHAEWSGAHHRTVGSDALSSTSRAHRAPRDGRRASARPGSRFRYAETKTHPRPGPR